MYKWKYTAYNVYLGNTTIFAHVWSNHSYILMHAMLNYEYPLFSQSDDVWTKLWQQICCVCCQPALICSTCPITRVLYVRMYMYSFYHHTVLSIALHYRLRQLFQTAFSCTSRVPVALHRRLRQLLYTNAFSCTLCTVKISLLHLESEHRSGSNITCFFFLVFLGNSVWWW